MKVCYKGFLEVKLGALKVDTGSAWLWVLVEVANSVSANIAIKIKRALLLLRKNGLHARGLPVCFDSFFKFCFLS